MALNMHDLYRLEFDCPSCSYQDDSYLWKTVKFVHNQTVYEKGDRVGKEDKDGVKIQTLCPECNEYVQTEAEIEDYKVVGKK